MLRLAGNFADAPFTPAHLNDEEFKVFMYADLVLECLFPALGREEDALMKRMREVDRMGKQAPRIRFDEHLLDRYKLLTSLRFSCRVALCCIVARRRTWKRWAIMENQSTLWELANHPLNRSIHILFDNPDANRVMNRLAEVVRTSEDAEITTRKACPENRVSAAVVSAVNEMREENAQMMKMFMNAVLPGKEDANRAMAPAPQPAAVASTVTSTPTPPRILSGGDCVRVKRKRLEYKDIVYFTSWGSMADALDYARTQLAPMEKEALRSGDYSWRIFKMDGIEKKGNDVRACRRTRISSFEFRLFHIHVSQKHWRRYRAVAIKLGALEEELAVPRAEALRTVQELFEAKGSHEAFVKMLEAEQKAMIRSRKDALAQRVLEY